MNTAVTLPPASNGKESMTSETTPTRASSRSVDQYNPTAVIEHLLDADKARLCELYWQRHPRLRFFKSVPPQARVLDVGCGSAGVSFWRQYLDPDRSDIQLHGVDIARGEHADRLASFSIVDMNTSALPFGPGFFGAAMSAHVLEHLESAKNTFTELYRCTTPGAQVYIEVPGPASALPPAASMFKAAGWPMMISNFHDDTTHITLWQPDVLIAQAEGAGFKLRCRGVVNDRYLEDTLMAAGMARRDEELMLYGFWSKSDWSDYFIFEHVDS